MVEEDQVHYLAQALVTECSERCNTFGLTSENQSLLCKDFAPKVGIKSLLRIKHPLL